LAAYLVAVFPGNLYVAVSGVEVAGQPGGIYPWLRLPFQAPFIALALWSSGATSRSAVESALSDIAAAVTGRTTRVPIGGNR
jgi:uncharacterized membrane protein